VLPLERRAAGKLGGYVAGGSGFALEKPAEIRNLRLRPGIRPFGRHVR
jgi:hypothetical protein